MNNGKQKACFGVCGGNVIKRIEILRINDVDQMLSISRSETRNFFPLTGNWFLQGSLRI